jgi:egghead protein (zeste-white 4 protein)
MASHSNRLGRRHWRYRPQVAIIFVAFPVTLFLTGWFALPSPGLLGWLVSICWTWPILANLVGFYGILRTRRQLRRMRRTYDEDAIVTCPDQLIVLVPTIARHDTYPALERSVLSFVASLPKCFPDFRVDIAIEEGSEARDRVFDLARRSARIRVVVVPKAYATPNGTRFKARANHYMHELRIAEAEARDDAWVLHMDDDTGLAVDSAVAMAQFIEAQRAAGADAKHLAQGILTYPRENAVNYLTWLADALRPADDVARFSALTGNGRPLLGLHGELLLIRASIEATIGWDFGPKAIVEDAQLALVFARQYGGASAWFPGRCYGASPATVRDFVKQRERWSWGLVALSFNRTLPLRQRLLMLYCVLSWVIGPLQNVVFVLLLGYLLDDVNTSPVTLFLLPLWSFNLAFTIWQYWEGLRINARVSRSGRRRFYEPVLIVLLIPLLSLLEGIGGLRGFLKYVRGVENEFVVIAKPA